MVEATALAQAPTTPSSPTLRQRVLRAGGWNMASYAVAQAIRLGGNLVMTRLLVPEMFGVMAIATMVTVVLSLLSDLGLRQSIVHSRRADDPLFLDSAWVVQIVRGVILWVAALALSVALYMLQRAGMVGPMSVYGSPVLPAVIAVSAFSAVIGGFQSTKLVTALRSLDQKRLVQVELAGQLAALVVMIAVGLMSRSIWALVAGGLVASLTSMALSHAWVSGRRNRFRWERESVRELLEFGKWIIVSSALFVIVTNGDRLLLGAVVNAEVLGFYSIAALIIGAIEGGLNKLFIMVSLPAFGEVARTDRSRLRAVYYKFRVPGDLLLLFFAGLLFAAGQAAIDVLYDPRYAAAGWMLEILALSLVAARYGVAHQLYLALGMPRYLTAINIARCVSFYTLVPLLYSVAGIPAAIWGIALHALATMPLVHYFNAKLALNDWRCELKVLLALPAGWLCGLGLRLIPG